MNWPTRNDQPEIPPKRTNQPHFSTPIIVPIRLPHKPLQFYSSLLPITTCTTLCSPFSLTYIHITTHFPALPFPYPFWNPTYNTHSNGSQYPLKILIHEHGKTNTYIWNFLWTCRFHYWVNSKRQTPKNKNTSSTHLIPADTSWQKQPTISVHFWPFNTFWKSTQFSTKQYQQEFFIYLITISQCNLPLPTFSFFYYNSLFILWCNLPRTWTDISLEIIMFSKAY